MATFIGILAMTALAIGIIGWLWITVMAFSEGEPLWGVGCMIISPLALVYGILNFQELKIPVLMLTFGFIGRIVFAVLASTVG